ncbi:MAG: histidine phosphatase family protein [Actinomycetota bacterium]|nr:histidine phosphatase family protein [Actinomycetota bacterium]
MVLWRHGQTAFNAERRFQGQRDVPLNAVGRAQARRAARHLATLEPTELWSSDLSRAASTAGYLARLTGLEIRQDKDLRERHGGAWEGLTIEEIRERYPDDLAAWEPPGGETLETVAERTAAALARIAAGAAPGSLVVVTGHGASLTWGMSRLLGLDDRVTGGMGNCCWSLLSRRVGHDRWRLLEFNVGALPEPVEVAELGEDD